MEITFKIIILIILSTSLIIAQVHHFSIALVGESEIPKQTAGVSFFIEIVARDSVNGIVDSFMGTVDVSSTGNLLDGNGITDPFIAGVLASHEVKFSNIGLFEFTVTQTSGTAVGTSNTFIVQAGTPVVLQVESAIDGTGIIIPSQSITAGENITLYSITRDTLNNFVANIRGATWTVETLSGDVQTSDLVINGDSSAAIFTGHLTGSGKIHATANDVAGIPSGNITVVSGAASNLIFLQQPTNGIAGTILSPSPIVRITDTFGNYVYSSGREITLTIPPTQGTLIGTSTKTSDSTGQTIFADLQINSFGKKVLFASADSLTTAIGDTFQLNPLIINASAANHGTITPNGVIQLLYGSVQTFFITPDTGYHTDSITVDGIRTDSISSYTFINITDNHSIEAFFSINSYTINAVADANGTISPAGSLVFNYGSSQSYSMIADFGYHIDSVFVDGLFVGSLAIYIFDNINTDHNIRVTFEADIPVVNSKIFLQGAYNSGAMTTLLNTILPNTQPYNRSPWNYNGPEFSSSIPSGVVDWILVELRTGPQSSTRVAIRAGFVKSDGTIVESDGISLLAFPTVLIGNYYIILHHRNHLSIMSSFPVNLTASSALYDFTTNISQFYGGSAAALSGGKYGMYSGDSSHDGFIDSDDFMGPDNNMFKSGYRDADHSLDGFIDSDDFMSPDNNMFKSSQVPS
ncbi:MAG: hypothetical protein HZB59_10765 [Ignavibacteriales bacterium]|nr:hypothetical protein [Ignavibacteriales bacterium]